MTHQQAQETLDKIIGQIFGYKNPYDLATFMQKNAFDIRLPMQVFDSITNEPTWAQSINPTKYITMKNALDGGEDKWNIEKRPLESIQDILSAWEETNFMATERQIDSENISESDNVYGSKNIYRSQDIHTSSNVLFCDSAHDLEYCAAVQRSTGVQYGVRIEDSKETTSSYSVIWSGKISNSMFIQDCYDMFECMFCSHMSGKKYCIANMQFTEEEYFKIKDMVIKWILSS